MRYKFVNIKLCSLVGFRGDRCETVILNPCDADPCPAGASCIRQGLLDYECRCPSGYYGATCTTRKYYMIHRISRLF